MVKQYFSSQKIFFHQKKNHHWWKNWIFIINTPNPIRCSCARHVPDVEPVQADGDHRGVPVFRLEVGAKVYGKPEANEARHDHKVLQSGASGGLLVHYRRWVLSHLRPGLQFLLPARRLLWQLSPRADHQDGSLVFSDQSRWPLGHCVLCAEEKAEPRFVPTCLSPRRDGCLVLPRRQILWRWTLHLHGPYQLLRARHHVLLLFLDNHRQQIQAELLEETHHTAADGKQPENRSELTFTLTVVIIDPIWPDGTPLARAEAVGRLRLPQMAGVLHAPTKLLHFYSILRLLPKGV